MSPFVTKEYVTQARYTTLRAVVEGERGGTAFPQRFSRPNMLGARGRRCCSVPANWSKYRVARMRDRSLICLLIHEVIIVIVTLLASAVMMIKILSNGVSFNAKCRHLICLESFVRHAVRRRINQSITLNILMVMI